MTEVSEACLRLWKVHFVCDDERSPPAEARHVFVKLILKNIEVVPRLSPVHSSRVEHIDQHGSPFHVPHCRRQDTGSASLKDKFKCSFLG